MMEFASIDSISEIQIHSLLHMVLSCIIMYVATVGRFVVNDRWSDECVGFCERPAVGINESFFE